MFVNPKFSKRRPIWSKPAPYYFNQNKVMADGSVETELVSLNDVVTPEQQEAVPIDLAMCRKLGVNLEQVNVSLDPTDFATIERHVEDLTQKLSDQDFEQIFFDKPSEETV